MIIQNAFEIEGRGLVVTGAPGGVFDTGPVEIVTPGYPTLYAMSVLEMPSPNPNKIPVVCLAGIDRIISKKDIILGFSFIRKI